MRRSHDQRGAVTAELALAIPMLLAITVALVWLLSVGVAQVRAVDAAREVARALARGEDQGTAVTLGLTVAPAAADIQVSNDGDRVSVRVTGRVAAPLVSWRLPLARYDASAVAHFEPGLSP